MKKAILSIAFLLIAHINIAQESSFKADVLKMIALSGSDAQLKTAKSQFLKMIPESNQAAFSEIYESTITGFYDKVVKIYMETYTHEDRKGMIAFYESPLGKKINKNASAITEKSIQAAQEWAKGLKEISEKYNDAFASQYNENVSDNTVYNTAGIDVKPDFPGGIDEFNKFISKNINSPSEVGLKGKIYVTFIIEKDGSLTDIKVLRDIGYGTGKEAIRVLELSPKWSPGEQNGKKVRCTFSLPIAIMAK
ncbi:DUF2059 domain-containing protein [Flavobacterium sp.]|jgi:hypothetical protein|uniref:DUF2059 domain-containing protein n=1 Tax=Flavobacterium sp. TaxID=239 RepID=UPI0037BFB915